MVICFHFQIVMNAKTLAMVMVKNAQIFLAHISVNVSQDTYQMAPFAEVTFCPCVKARKSLIDNI